jgi:hypothetical protein
MRFSYTGVTYVYKGTAERPKAACDSEVGYELLPIYEQWWQRSQAETTEFAAFDEYFEYAPFGNRPRMKLARISGAFLGRKEASNKARPFWGWFDTKARKAGAVNTGQWALDPAYSLSRNLTVAPAQRFSLDYTYNPWLDIVTDAPRASMAAPPQFVAATPVPASGLPAPAPAGGPGQVFSGDNRGKLTDIFRRVGVGRGGQDGLNAVADMLGVRPGAAAVSGICTLTVTTSGALEISLQGSTSSAEAATLSCDQPLPAATVRIRTELKSGPSDPLVLELPSQDNQYTTKLRLTQAGTWTVLIHWTNTSPRP